MLKCNNCKKDVYYKIRGLCQECTKRAEEINAQWVYPLKIVSLLEKILEELKSIKDVKGN